MVILHIACLNELKFSGVGVVVPQIVASQQKNNIVGLVNLSNIPIHEIDNQLNYNKKFDISDLRSPFNHPDLVVFHEIYYRQYLHIYKNLMQNKIKYIIVPHGGLTSKAQKIKKLKKLFANFVFFNDFVHNAAGIHFLSRDEMKESNLKSMKYFICGNGINSLNDHPKQFTSNFIFTYIGRISIFHKGLDLLVDAFNLYNKNHNTKIYLNIYGPDGKDYQKLSNLIKSKKDPCIYLYKEIFGSKKLEILKSSTYFIQASRFEGMPMGILEALSFGIPVVATEGTNMSEYIDCYHAGFCSDNSLYSIVEAINRAANVSNDEYELMSYNATKLIKDNFSWDKISKQTIQGYNYILSTDKANIGANVDE